LQAIHKCKEKGEILTGLLYLDPDCEDLHEMIATVETPLRDLDEVALCPGSNPLDAINDSLR
jgi:2-oxoglutarate ferredoxin oxidoreductase subunit beta